MSMIFLKRNNQILFVFVLVAAFVVQQTWQRSLIDSFPSSASANADVMTSSGE